LGLIRLHHRAFWLAAIGVLSLPQAQDAAADAVSSASVKLSDYPDFSLPNSSSVSTAGSDLVSTSLPSGASGSAQSVLGTGSVGVQLQLPATTNNGLYQANASWSDNWSGTAASQGATVPILSTITLDGSIDKSFIDAFNNNTLWASAVSFDFRYEIGDHLFHVAMVSDDTVPQVLVKYDSTDLTSILTFTPDPSSPLLMHFALTYTPTLDVSSSAFSDSMTATLYVSGNGPSMDAIHTFRTELQSLDPSVVFTADSGRSIAAAVPEPTSIVLVSLGLAGIGFARRRLRR
jgi:hypothetical protein